MNESLDDTIVNSIVVCIQEAVGFGRKAFESLSLMTDVARDLGIDGDDANDLMVEFFRRFLSTLMITILIGILWVKVMMSLLSGAPRRDAGIYR